MLNLAPKPNGTFRIVHQLDPCDSLIYTALVREICESVEQYRIPESENIACSYRIKPNIDGSFFSTDTGWDTYINQTTYLSDEFKTGWVIAADITDFYNQIYTHRIKGLIEESGNGTYDQQARIIEDFLLSLNKRTSRGIPVGPIPSIILAELIMASIDKKILEYTNKFVRYVDDIRIYFNKVEDAVNCLHDLTLYLHNFHRLVFSGEKTEIIPVNRFLEKYMEDEEKAEKAALVAKANELAHEKMDDFVKNLPPYHADFDYKEEYEKTLASIVGEKRLELIASTYYELFQKALALPRDYGLLRHLIRQATRYRIRNIIPLLLDNFYSIRPVIREAIIYLNAVINDRTIFTYKAKFERLYSSFFLKLPFINLWVSHLLHNVNFNKIGLPSNYDRIINIRGQALMSLRKKDTTWVRSHRDSIDMLGPWDKRAVLYSTLILPLDEMQPFVRTYTSSDDIIEKSIASFILSKKKSLK
ncbi:MAG: RNA-directed DNA polymerase [Dehalococcoidia bacterium]|nr:MAG: RNA-directed DNA polymerase [Dehalococcoidia bacterium]